MILDPSESNLVESDIILSTFRTIEACEDNLCACFGDSRLRFLGKHCVPCETKGSNNVRDRHKYIGLLMSGIQGTELEGKRYKIVLGDSIRNADSNAGCLSMRYKFKPGSIDRSKPGTIRTSESKTKGHYNVSIPAQGTDECHEFMGFVKDEAPEFALILDKKRNVFVMERVHTILRLTMEQRTRAVPSRTAAKPIPEDKAKSEETDPKAEQTQPETEVSSKPADPKKPTPSAKQETPKSANKPKDETPKPAAKIKQETPKSTPQIKQETPRPASPLQAAPDNSKEPKTEEPVKGVARKKRKTAEGPSKSESPATVSKATKAVANNADLATPKKRTTRSTKQGASTRKSTTGKRASIEKDPHKFDEEEMSELAESLNSDMTAEQQSSAAKTNTPQSQPRRNSARVENKRRVTEQESSEDEG